MKLDPQLSSDDITTLLVSQSEQIYGTERTKELRGQIEQLAFTLAELAGRELDLRGPAPDTSGITQGVAR